MLVFAHPWSHSLEGWHGRVYTTVVVEVLEANAESFQAPRSLGSELRTKLLLPHSIGQIKSQVSPYSETAELDSTSESEVVQQAIAPYTNSNPA